jgi:hypothetical protein
MLSRIGRSLALALVAGGIMSSAASAQSIQTLFAQNNFGNPGGVLFFDLTVGPSNITVTGMATNTDAAGTFGFTMYTKTGTYLGSETNAAAWSVATTGVGTGAGLNAPSTIALNNPVVLNAGTTYGVALVLADTGQTTATHYYTNGTGANQTYSNADLTLNLGAAENVPFTAPIFTPRVWNGVINYGLGGTLGACCLPAPNFGCTQTTQTSCVAQGGTYVGDNIPCASSGCTPTPTGACCTETAGCTILTAAACTAAGGNYAGNNVTCAIANCPPISAWVEQGEAGDLPGTAQTVLGTGTLNSIRGGLAADDVDMYQINICDEANFSATTEVVTTFDTQLFIFNTSGVGVVMDDDTDALSTTLQSTITSQFVSSSGLYLLAITGYNRDPADSGTQLIWNNTDPAGNFGPEWIPNGPGAANPVAGWTGANATGSYRINLTGSCFVGGAIGACCLGAPSYSCTVTSAASCASQGGTYAGDGVTCALANCPPPPTGSCCAFNGSCTVVTQAACTAAGGIYGGNSSPCGTCPSPYAETGDAGNLPGTAAVISGSGPLPGITGSLGADDSDMYRFSICNEATFSASTEGLATFDTQLFIFNTAGNGVVMDDDTPLNAQSLITSQFVTANGEYFIAISQYNKDPLDAGGLLIWNNTNPAGNFQPEWVPNGPGAANPVASWGVTTTTGGTYGIRLTGSCYIGGGCYANCDGTGGLTANDFICFLTAYNQNAPYADCDGVGGLTANDFICFVTAYNNGCS